MKNPVERLIETLLNNDSQKAALITSGKNRRYFTQFPSSAGILFITAGGAYLQLDSRYAEAGANKAKNCQATGYTDLAAKFGEIISAHGVKEVYMEADQLTVSMARRFEGMLNQCGAQAVLDGSLDAAIRNQRMIKSPEEIAKIEAAQAITDATFEHILPFIKEGVTEKAIALEIELFMRNNGADGLSFPSIVAAGPQGSQPHAVPSDYQIKKGDMVTMDTGTLLDGYISDMTRTVAVGKISDEQRKVYDTVLKAHVEAMKVVKPGIVCKDVDKVARDIIEAEYPPEAFGHTLGHGVGLDVHEWPGFSRRDETITQPGMIITDEPGVYIPGKYGVRIEDMVLITEDGHRSLTHSPKELIEL